MYLRVALSRGRCLFWGRVTRLTYIVLLFCVYILLWCCKVWSFSHLEYKLCSKHAVLLWWCGCVWFVAARKISYQPPPTNGNLHHRLLMKMKSNSLDVDDKASRFHISDRHKSNSYSNTNNLSRLPGLCISCSV